MFEKIKSFFQNKTVQLVAWIMLVLSSIVLIVAGVAGEDINNVVSLVVGVVAAVGTLISVIAGLLNKTAKK